jgi:hypothetical protein
MSDTASALKEATLETRLTKMESQFSSTFARLEVILSGLSPQGLAADSKSGGSNPPVPLQANTLAWRFSPLTKYPTESSKKDTTAQN